MTEPISTGTRERAGARRRFAIAGGLCVLVVAMGVGMLAATGRFWPPLQDQKPNRLTDVLTQTIETNGIGAAVAQYRRLRELGFPGLRESNADTNSLGYELLGKGEKESAIRVLQLNVETHPESANVYDSLGEAHLAAGNKALAIESYQKAVAIAPNKKGAVSALQKLTNLRRKPYRPMVRFHILAGSVALLSGALAMALRKGSRRHGVAGSVFVVSMLSMSGTGAYMAFVAPDGEATNVLMGALTFYLVSTASWTARRRDGKTGLFDWGALLVVLAVASGGLVGAQRIARHLWRMCSALFIAVTSLFLGQPQVFPAALRNSGVLVVPGALVVILLIVWLVRVLFTNAYRRTASAALVMR